jgi:alpha-galactosidase
LRALHPEVEWEACASGGGRVDYGAMPYFDEFWPSDNTDPLDRLSIQEGYSYLYPIKYMRAWVTDSGNNGKRAMPLLFRLHISMCGALGIGLNLNECTEEDSKLLEKYIAIYKEIRSIIQFGQLHRLASLPVDGLQAVQYENGEESVLFAFLDHPSRWRTTFSVRPRGLDAQTCYRVEIEGQQQQKYSGAFLMNNGLSISLNHDYASCMVRLLPE